MPTGYQTTLNFAPKFPVRRNRPAESGGSGRSKDTEWSKSNGNAGKTHDEHRRSHSKGDHNKSPPESALSSPADVKPSRPMKPTQLDVLSSDSDSDGDDIRATTNHGGPTSLSTKQRRQLAAKKLRERRQKVALAKKRNDWLEDTDEDEEESDGLEEKKDEEGQIVASISTSSKRRKRLGKKRKIEGSKNVKNRKIILDDDDDDELNDFIVEDDSDDDNLLDDQLDEPVKEPMVKRNHNFESFDDEEDDDHPMSHAALDFQLQMNQRDNDNDEAAELAGLLSANRRLSEHETFTVWLEDLALQAEAHLQRDKHTRHVSTPLQQRAARQFERPLCTRRESTLGSSAWRQEFRSALLHRPIYRAFELHALAVPSDVTCCGACGRSSHSITHRVELDGPRYDAGATWSCERTLHHADWDGILQNASEDDKAEVFFVGGHCCRRTHLYHSLLHYKFITFDTIQGMLAGDHSNVAIRVQLRENGQTLDQLFQKKRMKKAKKNEDRGVSESDPSTNNDQEEAKSQSISVEELMESKGFIEREYERARMLTEDAEENWGGSKAEALGKGTRTGSKISFKAHGKSSAQRNGAGKKSSNMSQSSLDFFAKKK